MTEQFLSCLKQLGATNDSLEHMKWFIQQDIGLLQRTLDCLSELSPSDTTETWLKLVYGTTKEEFMDVLRTYIGECKPIVTSSGVKISFRDFDLNTTIDHVSDFPFRYTIVFEKDHQMVYELPYKILVNRDAFSCTKVDHVYMAMCRWASSIESKAKELSDLILLLRKDFDPRDVVNQLGQLNRIAQETGIHTNVYNLFLYEFYENLRMCAVGLRLSDLGTELLVLSLPLMATSLVYQDDDGIVIRSPQYESSYQVLVKSGKVYKKSNIQAKIMARAQLYFQLQK